MGSSPMAQCLPNCLWACVLPASLCCPNPLRVVTWPALPENQAPCAPETLRLLPEPGWGHDSWTLRKFWMQTAFLSPHSFLLHELSWRDSLRRQSYVSGGDDTFFQLQTFQRSFVAKRWTLGADKRDSFPCNHVKSHGDANTILTSSIFKWVQSAVIH